MPHPLGRLEPPDWRHLEKFPLTAVAAATVTRVERLQPLPGWHLYHDQGREGSCVGHAVALERAVTNRMQLAVKTPVRYDPVSLWNRAKQTDDWPETNPGDSNGTSVRAAYEIARVEGLRPVKGMRMVGGVPAPVSLQPVDATSGVAAYRWARTVDEIRAAVASGLTVVLGVNWYPAFDKPERRVVGGKTQWWLPAAAGLGQARGGHAIACYGASDAKAAVRLKNSWGKWYPLVWLPYETLDVLLAQNGEAAVVTDR